MTEIWKDIEGYEGLYQVSSLGRVKALACVRQTKKGERRLKERIMKPLITPNAGNVEYLSVMLYADGHSKRRYIHRLVASAFIENKDNKPQVNHKDGNGRNNTVENLEWVTPQENIAHAWDNGLLTKDSRKKCSELMKARTKEKHPLWRGGVIVFTLEGEEVVRCGTLEETRRWIAKNTTYIRATISHISAVCRGEQKTAYGFRFEYLK